MLKPKHVYAALCLPGAILPYSQFVPWLLQNGLDFRALVSDLLANRITAFFALDVIVSAVVLLAFAGYEDRRAGSRSWPAVALSTLTVGVSLGLPLFLYLRERSMERLKASRTARAID